MRALGIVLIVLGLAGGGVAAYGHVTMTEAQDTITTKTQKLNEAFPGLADSGLDPTKVEDLVAIDRAIQHGGIPELYMLDSETKSLAWDILDAMGDKEEGENIRLYAGAAGGVLLLLGLILAALGGKKKKPAEA